MVRDGASFKLGRGRNERTSERSSQRESFFLHLYYIQPFPSSDSYFPLRLRETQHRLKHVRSDLERQPFDGEGHSVRAPEDQVCVFQVEESIEDVLPGSIGWRSIGCW